MVTLNSNKDIELPHATIETYQEVVMITLLPDVTGMSLRSSDSPLFTFSALNLFVAVVFTFTEVVTSFLAMLFLEELIHVAPFQY